MGLFDRFRRFHDPVEGTAIVVSATQPHSGTSGTGRFQLVVEADGVPATAVEHTCMTPTDRWPYAGMTVPVRVDRADPTRVRIRFDAMETARDRSRREAQALARARR